MAGTLYIVATPIGNLDDMPPRVAATFGAADFIAAEDTRVTMKLLNFLGLKKPMVSYYEHALQKRRRHPAPHRGGGELRPLLRRRNALRLRPRRGHRPGCAGPRHQGRAGARRLGLCHGAGGFGAGHLRWVFEGLPAREQKSRSGSAWPNCRARSGRSFSTKRRTNCAPRWTIW